MQPKTVDRDLIKSQLEERFSGNKEEVAAQPPQEAPKQEAQPEKVVEPIKQETPKAESQPQEEIKKEAPQDALPSSLKPQEKKESFDEEAFLKIAQEKGLIKKDEFKTGHEVVDSILEKHLKEGVDWNKDLLHKWTDNIESYNIENQSEALELVRRRMQNEGFTKKQIDFKLKKDYQSLYDNIADEDEVNEALMQLSIDASGAKKEILKEREKYFIPEKNSQPTQTVYKEALVKESISKMYDDTRKDMSEYFDKNLSNYEKETFSIGDKSIEIKITPEMNEKVKDDFSNYFSLLDRKAKENGDNPAEYLRKTILTVNYLDDILKTVADQFSAEAKESVVKDEILNVDDNKTKDSKTLKTVDPSQYPNRQAFLKAQIEQKIKAGQL